MPDALKRNERQACWAARDAYYGCLDTNLVPHLAINPEKKVMEAKDSHQSHLCSALNEQFHAACPAPWRDHFERIWNAKVYRHVATRDNYTGPVE